MLLQWQERGTLARVAWLSLVPSQGMGVSSPGDAEITCGMGLLSFYFKKIKMSVTFPDVFKQFKLQGRCMYFMFYVYIDSFLKKY